MKLYEMGEESYAQRDPFGALCNLRGDLDRAVAQSGWWAPRRLDLDSDMLRWYPDRNKRFVDVQWIGPEKGMLEGFVKLAEAEPGQIKCFAERWGVLVICEHDLPASHNPPCIPRTKRTRKTWCLPRGWKKDGRGKEPLAVWRAFSREANAIMRAACRLHDSKDCDPRDWEILKAAAKLRRVPFPPDEYAGCPKLRLQKLGITMLLQNWLDLGLVHPVFVWDTAGPSILVASGGLFAALAYQLVLAVSQSEGLAICSGCGGLYVPTRRPARGRKNYCPKCGPAAAWRDSKRRATDARKAP